MTWSKLSIRYKIMLALTLLPVAGLSIFLSMAVSVFEQDKIAYVFDSSLSASQTRAARVRSEMGSYVSIAQSAIASYRADIKALDEAGREIFKAQSGFVGLRLFAVDKKTGMLVRTVELQKGFEAAMPQTSQEETELLTSVQTNKVYAKRAIDGSSSLLLAARFGANDDPKRLVAIALFDATELADAFSSTDAFSSYLLQGDGQLVFGDPSFSGADRGWTTNQIFARLSSARVAAEGSAEIDSPTKRPYLASFAKVGSSDLTVVSLSDKGTALRAVKTLLYKAFLFFIATVSVTAIVSVFASRGLTSALRALSSAAQKIAGGDFGARVNSRGGDEIGRLGENFNAMAEKVSALMLETAEKARMETELATARTVQENLFPPSDAILGNVVVSGHYEPASECGGDWWYCCENGGFVYLWIGDVTGHGAPAALLTSAARAVASVIEMGEPRSPSECISILNRAIWDASKGKMMMTFFLAAIDQRTGIMSFANASHEAPLLLRASSEVPSRDDYVPLNDVNSPRLGEQSGGDFAEATVQLHAGDRLIFYTDGVTDVKSPDHKPWGERRFMKSLSARMHGTAGPAAAMLGIVADLQSYRSAAPLDDDVTLVMAEFRGNREEAA